MGRKRFPEAYGCQLRGDGYPYYLGAVTHLTLLFSSFFSLLPHAATCPYRSLTPRSFSCLALFHSRIVKKCLRPSHSAVSSPWPCPLRGRSPVGFPLAVPPLFSARPPHPATWSYKHQQINVHFFDNYHHFFSPPCIPLSVL